MSRIRVFLVLWAFNGLNLIPARGATDEQLEKLKAQINTEIGEIKHDYEARIKTLEERVKTLESDNAQLRVGNQGTARSAPAAPADEIAALKQRIAELEQARSERRDELSGAAAEIASLRKRLAQLENVATKAQTEVPAISQRESANAEAIQQIEAQLQASVTETRDIYHSEFGPPFDLTKLYDLPRPFEFHGYLRSGYGMNGEGGKMEAFKAPGAFAKYRLGNEAETYGEMALTNNWLREDDPLPLHT